MPSITFEAPVRLPRQYVQPGWIDYNGHMNLAYYLKAFDIASDVVFNQLGIGEDGAKAHNRGPMALQNQIFFLQEVVADDPLDCTFQLLDYDHKRVHFFMSLYHGTEGFLSATLEQLSTYVDLAARRTTNYPPETMNRLATMAEAHASLERPPQAGATIGIRRKPKN